MVSSLPTDVTMNEYDAYMNAPRVVDKGPLLDIWRTFSATSYPHLGLMARDVFPIAATGAGVERQFSRSGKVETKLRAWIDPVTTCETMMYMDMLKRKKRALGMTQGVARVAKVELESNEDEPPPD